MPGPTTPKAAPQPDLGPVAWEAVVDRALSGRRVATSTTEMQGLCSALERLRAVAADAARQTAAQGDTDATDAQFERVLERLSHG